MTMMVVESDAKTFFEFLMRLKVKVCVYGDVNVVKSRAFFFAYCEAC